MNKLIAFFSNSIRKYKQERVAAVIDTYATAQHVTIMRVLPEIVSLYHAAADVIVKRTYENPAPALELLEAVKKCSDHYGPELVAIATQYDINMKKVMNSDLVVSAFDRLTKAIEACKTDHNEETA